MLLRLDHNHAVSGDALITQLQQLFLVEIGERRSFDIKPQMNRGRDFIDMLATRALGANGLKIDLPFGNHHIIGNKQHSGVLLQQRSIQRFTPGAHALFPGGG